MAAAAAKSLQSCPTLCDPIDSSPPGSPIPGILQARTLEWVAISFSSAWKWKVKEKSLSRVWLFKNPWTAVYQAPPSMGFSRLEYWSGVPLPSPHGLCSCGLLFKPLVLIFRYSGFPNLGPRMGSAASLWPACRWHFRVTASSVTGYRAASQRHPETGFGSWIPGSIAQQVQFSLPDSSHQDVLYFKSVQ